MQLASRQYEYSQISCRHRQKDHSVQRSEQGKPLTATDSLCQELMQVSLLVYAPDRARASHQQACSWRLRGLLGMRVSVTPLTPKLMHMGHNTTQNIDSSSMLLHDSLPVSASNVLPGTGCV